MSRIFFTICSIILMWGFIELCWLIFENIFVAIDNFIQDRRLIELRGEFVDNPVELIGDNGKIYYIGYKNKERDQGWSILTG